MAPTLTIKGTVCNITYEQVLELYDRVGIELGRYLRGDYYIRIKEDDRTIHISDFGGTKSAGFMPRNTTLVIKGREPMETFPTYGAREHFIVGGHLLTDNDPTVRTTYTYFYDALEKAIQMRLRKKTTLLLSSGIDSGVIAAMMNRGSIKYTALSSEANEDQDVLKQRLELAPATRIIPPVPYAQLIEEYKAHADLSDFNTIAGLSHFAAAREVEPDHVVLSGLGVDELYAPYGPEDATLHDFMRTSTMAYDSFGIDIRYPLLDYRVWLEYNRLSPPLRNSNKKPFIKYLKFRNYPMQDERKHSFVAWT